MPKPKILFLSGQEIFNELDKKRYFETSSSSVHAQYAFILKVNEQYTAVSYTHLTLPTKA